MQKEINPIAMIAAVAVVVIVAGFFIFRAVTGTAATVHVAPQASHPNQPETINGKPIPPGVPASYYKEHMGQGGAGSPP